jgi:L-asparaginase II
VEGAQRGPVLVDVPRGAWIGSRHHGAIAVCDANGATVLPLGDVETSVLAKWNGATVESIRAAVDAR